MECSNGPIGPRYDTRYDSHALQHTLRHRSMSNNLKAPMNGSTPNSRFSSDFLAVAWPTLVFAVLIGFCLAIAIVTMRWRIVSSAWQERQLTVAKSDLLAIKTVFQIAATSKSENRWKPSRLTELDARSQRAIAWLAKGGELIWTGAVDSVALESQSPTQNEMTYIWSVEPGGYNRLKLTCRLDEVFDDGNELTLARRFSAKEFARLSFWDWVSASLLGSGSMLFGLWLAMKKYNRQQFLASLDAWSTQPTLQPSPLSLMAGDGVANAIARHDSSVARILQRASDGIQNRLESIQQSVEQSSRVMSAMPVGVLAFDPQFRLLFVNRAGRELLGLEASFQFGQNLIEVIRHPTVVNLIQEVSADPQIQEAELELPLSKATLRLRAHPLSDPDPSTTPTASSGVLLTVTDETRLKQLENARRDFTANVSHELKTPLSAIKAYAETLLMGALEDEQASQRFVERIAEQAHRLDLLIRDLLHLTKLQSQPDKPQLTDLSLDDVLKTCVEEHRTIGQARNISIDTTGVEPGCRVEADLESLRTVIGNLLGNAVRYNRVEGWVRVSSRHEPDHVVLIIADNGIGIPPEDLDRIFERFYRVEKARSQDTGGTGLGLSIVKHLVQGMSAEIQVFSILGKGSSFELRLRCAEARRGGTCD